eukprot:6563169-Pyramimonas_sp.AAC.1
MRNLGHELHGPVVKRTIAKKRLATLKQRLKRVQAFRRTVGTKVTQLWRAGLLPSVAHGSVVSGASDKELEAMRSAAADMAGYPKRGASGTLYLAAQRDPWHGPIFDATTRPRFAYHRLIWEQLIGLGRLERAWQALDRSSLNWGTARGPIAVVTLSLQRVGWCIKSPTVVQDDQDNCWSLLQVAPMLLRDLLRAGIQRLQMRRILVHHEQREATTTIWARGLRACLGGPAAT